MDVLGQPLGQLAGEGLGPLLVLGVTHHVGELAQARGPVDLGGVDSRGPDGGGVEGQDVPGVVQTEVAVPLGQGGDGLRESVPGLHVGVPPTRVVGDSDGGQVPGLTDKLDEVLDALGRLDAGEQLVQADVPELRDALQVEAVGLVGHLGLATGQLVLLGEGEGAGDVGAGGELGVPPVTVHLGPEDHALVVVVPGGGGVHEGAVVVQAQLGGTLSRGEVDGRVQPVSGAGAPAEGLPVGVEGQGLDHHLDDLPAPDGLGQDVDVLGVEVHREHAVGLQGEVVGLEGRHGLHLLDRGEGAAQPGVEEREGVGDGGELDLGDELVVLGAQRVEVVLELLVGGEGVVDVHGGGVGRHVRTFLLALGQL